MFHCYYWGNQPGFGGPRFRRAAQGALVFPDDEEEKHVITPDPIKIAETTNDTAASIGATAEKSEGEQNSTDLESRFGFHGRGPFRGLHFLQILHYLVRFI